MKNLIEPTEKYIDRIENSWHYLNCPKHMLNHDLDCLYRQAMGFDNNKILAIKYISDYLNTYNVPKPLETATKFVNWRMSISLKDFIVLNVNNYVNNTPQHIDIKHKHICDWVESHTTYYPALYGGGVNYVPTYPMKYK